jgi:hypothetical protein
MWLLEEVAERVGFESTSDMETRSFAVQPGLLKY